MSDLMHDMGDWMMFGGGWPMMGFMFLIWLVVIAAIVAGVVFVVRAQRQDGVSGAGRPGRRAALDTLEERYARGEIDRDEFEERRRTLNA